MKTLRSFALVAACLAASAASAYQVTGTVESVTDGKIVVLATGGKNKGEKFELAREPGTKVTGELEKGAKVTVEYSMQAQSIEVKPSTEVKVEKKSKTKK